MGVPRLRKGLSGRDDELREWHLHTEAYAARREGQIHLRVERTGEVTLDHQCAEPAMRGHGDLAAARLFPEKFEAGAFACRQAPPHDRNLACRCCKRAM